MHELRPESAPRPPANLRPPHGPRPAQPGAAVLALDEVYAEIRRHRAARLAQVAASGARPRDATATAPEPTL